MRSTARWVLSLGAMSVSVGAGLAACADSHGFADGGADSASDVNVIFESGCGFCDAEIEAAPTPDAAVCVPPAPPDAGFDGGPPVSLAPAFQKDYAVYDIGAPPGVPDPLGGCTIDWKDDNTLLIAGGSEDQTAGAIYSIPIKRDACGHVLGWNGTATLVAHTPYVDANLVYVGTDADAGADGGPLMIYSEWPNAGMGQLLPTGTSPARETDLSALGLISQGSLGGLGFVPQGLASAGELRGVTYPVYNGISQWHHIQVAADGQLLKVTSVTPTLELRNGCGAGGFAYVPAGSPDFPIESILVAEWDPNKNTRVSGYNVNSSGDPIVSSRFDFLRSFYSPWGAYFDRVSGDYMFLQWTFGFQNVADTVFVVRGFNKPPAPPPPPK